MGGSADKDLTALRHSGYKSAAIYSCHSSAMLERLLDTMSTLQGTLQPGQIVHDDPGVRATGLLLWSMASGVLLLALSWGDLSSFLTR